MQVYDIPMSFMNKTVAEGLCLGIGEVCPSNFSIMEGGDHLRVHVILDISKPLCRECKITLKGGTTGWVSFKYERLPSICYWGGCVTHDDEDCDLWITSEGTFTVKDWNYGAWLRAPFSNQIRKSTIVVPGFYQQKKDSKVSNNSRSEPLLKPHQASSPKNGVPMKPLEKVIPDSLLPSISNSTAHPIFRGLDDLPPRFRGQFNIKRNLVHTLYEIHAELNKCDMMEDIDGNLEFLSKKESATLAKPKDEDIQVQSPTQLSTTCKSPSLITKSDRPPLIDLSNTLDSPTCTSLPPKPS